MTEKVKVNIEEIKKIPDGKKKKKRLEKQLLFALLTLSSPNILTSLFCNSLLQFLFVLQGQLYPISLTACLLGKTYDKNYKGCGVAKQADINTVNEFAKLVSYRKTEDDMA